MQNSHNVDIRELSRLFRLGGSLKSQQCRCCFEALIKGRITIDQSHREAFKAIIGSEMMSTEGSYICLDCAKFLKQWKVFIELRDTAGKIQRLQSHYRHLKLSRSTVSGKRKSQSPKSSPCLIPPVIEFETEDHDSDSEGRLVIDEDRIDNSSHEDISNETRVSIPLERLDYDTIEKLKAKSKAQTGAKTQENCEIDFHDHRSTPITAEQNLSCDLCGFKTEDKLSILNHMTIRHNKTDDDDKFQCQIDGCGKSFNNANSLYCHRYTDHKRHPQKTSMSSKKFNCDLCGYKTKVQAILGRHMISIHQRNEALEQNPFKCMVEGCGKSFRSKRPWYYHKYNVHTHDSEDKTTCPICEKPFKNLKYMKQHKRRYHKKKIVCNQCDAAFYSQIQLEDHVSTSHKTDKRSYLCSYPDCSEMFPSKGHAKVHLQHDHKLNGDEYRTYSRKFIRML